MISKYKRIKLKDGSTRDEHRLVMEKYLGRTLDFNEVVHHIDGNGLNNKLENLELCERSQHSYDHRIGTSIPKEVRLKMGRKGSQHSQAKLTEKDVLNIRMFLSNGSKEYILLAKIYNVSPRTIVKIKNREQWKHI